MNSNRLTQLTNEQLKTALRTWVERKNLTAAQFGRDMNYLDPSYGWALLRGKAVVTPECLGRFVLAYGGTAAEEVMVLAGSPNDGDRRQVQEAS